MPQSTLNWKIAGAGGFGLQAAASVFARAFVRAGYFVHTYAEFPSIIKGGHAAASVRVSTRPLLAHQVPVDVLVCLDRESFDRHLGEVARGGVVLYDATDVPIPPRVPRSIVLVPMSMGALTLEVGGEKIMRNAVSLGATLAVLGRTTDALRSVVRDVYTKRGGPVVARNQHLIELGYRAAETYPRAQRRLAPPRRRPGAPLLLAGNEAIGFGAIHAGCRYYSGYPMTPSSSLLKFMAAVGSRAGVVVRQEQDELAVINSAIGASFVGARSMVASSGGGFSLMVEGYGLAAMTETPLVVVEAMRPGPATGLPTWTEQGDLRFVLHAAQGEFPRVVLAPGSVEECFALTHLAFNLADRYQTPVILLTDKYLGESQWTVPPLSARGLRRDRGKIRRRPTARYRRYADSADGVSPRVLPGTPGAWYIANSDEHDERGLSCEERSVRVAQSSRRLRKLRGLVREVPAPRRIGPARASLTVVTWGSSTPPVREALACLRERGIRANAIQILAMSPFPSAATRRLLASAQRLVVVEGNATGQLQGLIREQTGLAIDPAVRRADGRPFDPVALADDLTRYAH